MHHSSSLRREGEAWRSQYITSAKAQEIYLIQWYIMRCTIIINIYEL